MPDTENTQQALIYLRQHRGTHGIDALRQQLLAAGYTSSAVDEALTQLDRAEESRGWQVEVLADSRATAATERGAVDSMVAYLRQHGGQYDPDALRRQLLAAGQEPTLVDRAVRQAGLPARRAEELAWPLGLLVALLNSFLLPLVSGLISILGNTSSTAVAIGTGVALLVLLAEGVLGVLLLRGTRPRLGRALLWGLLFSLVVPIVFGLLLLGIGIAYFSVNGFSP